MSHRYSEDIIEKLVMVARQAAAQQRRLGLRSPSEDNVMFTFTLPHGTVNITYGDIARAASECGITLRLEGDDRE